MKRTNISIVGSGNVATHLGLALKAAGCNIHQVLSRSLQHAQLLAMRVGAVPIDRWQSLDEYCDAYILAVNDDAIFDLALDLKLKESLVVHTSGSTPASVLRNVSDRHGVVWSPQTFVRDIAMDYSTLPLCIEGCNQETESEIEELLGRVTRNIYHLDYNQRIMEHLAAVMVSNFVNAINATAQDYMKSEGLDFEMLRPLAEQTLKKWNYGPLWFQQTGPAIRHDERTLNTHRKMLADQPELLKVYDFLTDLIENHKYSADR